MTLRYWSAMSLRVPWGPIQSPNTPSHLSPKFIDHYHGRIKNSCSSYSAVHSAYCNLQTTSGVYVFWELEFLECWERCKKKRKGNGKTRQVFFFYCLTSPPLCSISTEQIIFWEVGTELLCLGVLLQTRIESNSCKICCFGAGFSGS